MVIITEMSTISRSNKIRFLWCRMTYMVIITEMNTISCCCVMQDDLHGDRHGDEHHFMQQQNLLNYI